MSIWRFPMWRVILLRLRLIAWMWRKILALLTTERITLGLFLLLWTKNKRHNVSNKPSVQPITDHVCRCAVVLFKWGQKKGGEAVPGWWNMVHPNIQTVIMVLLSLT
ncbi:MAG: hypothetical protein J3Q66DRAFT_160474 [Benniella sp.]|nr:MAG: hypothetical protein J3Q66DRAFT_160474 [Benniella sp.]